MSSSQPNSLLPQEEDAEAPFLGAQPEIEPSPLELMIQTTSEQAAASTSFFNLHDVISPIFPTTSNNSNRQSQFSFARRAAAPRIQTSSSSGTNLTTMFAGTLSAFQIFLIWGSYLSNSWFDSFVRVKFDWSSTSQEIQVNSTTLATLLSALNGAEQHGATLVLLLSSLLLPCLCMLVGPTWTAGDHIDRIHQRAQALVFPRIVFEHLVKFSLLIVFVLTILDVGTSSITLSGAKTKVEILNSMRGGIVCYAVGSACTIFAILILRGSRKELPELTFHATTPDGVAVPPQQAFQLPWLRSSRQPATSSNTNDNDDNNDAAVNDVEDVNGELQRPLLQAESLFDTEGTSTGARLTSYCEKAIVYEVGLLAVLSWLPALFFPFVQLNFSGLAADFISKKRMEVNMFQLPHLLWKRGIAAGSQKWMLLSVGSVVLTFVYVIPLLVTIVCLWAWASLSTQGRQRYRVFIQWCHPAMSGIVFVCAVLIGVPALQPVSEFLITSNTGGVCTQFKQFVGEDCLALTGTVELGTWFLLAQSIALELFVRLTLYRTRPRQTDTILL
jgi:hypothetical protein